MNIPAKALERSFSFFPFPLTCPLNDYLCKIGNFLTFTQYVVTRPYFQWRQPELPFITKFLGSYY